jgi:hypothetical protein
MLLKKNIEKDNHTTMVKFQDIHVSSNKGTTRMWNNSKDEKFNLRKETKANGLKLGYV